MGTVSVAGQDFVVSSATPGQVAGIMKVLSTATKKISGELRGIDDPDSMAVISAILGSVDEDQLITLASISIGSDKQFARENFDLVWVTEALAELSEVMDFGAIIKNFTRIISNVQS